MGRFDARGRGAGFFGRVVIALFALSNPVIANPQSKLAAIFQQKCGRSDTTARWLSFHDGHPAKLS
jgi:hypothetical protein